METRRRILQAATERFWTQGYGATRISQILSDAEANSGSLYNEFGGKEGLMLAVLDRFGELMEPLVFGPAARESSDPVERVIRVFQGYRAQLVETDFRFGSPIGNLAGELSHTHPRFREKLAELFLGWRRRLRTLLETSDPPPSREVDTDRISSLVFSLLQGAVSQARVTRDPEPIDQAVGALERTLPSILAQSA